MARNYVRELAQTLISADIERREATRPVDVKTTKAKIDGATRAAYACGFGHTPYHVEASVQDSMIETLALLGEVPAPHTAQRRAWNDEAVDNLQRTLSELLTH